MNSNLPNFGGGNPSQGNPLGGNYGDPTKPTADEEGFHRGQQMLGSPGADFVWYRPFQKWCPYTYAMTIQTGFIGLLLWLVSMMKEGSADEAPVRLVWQSLYVICWAGLILLPLFSLMKINWTAQLFWLALFFWYVVFGQHQKWDIWLMWVVLGSAVSEIVVALWARSGHEESLLSYRVKQIGRYLVFALVIGGTLARAGMSVYDYIQYKKTEPQRIAEIERQRKEEREADATAQKSPPPPSSLPQPQVSSPVATPPLPSTPLPSREPDHQFRFTGSPAADSPQSRSYLFTDIEFESAAGPSPEAYNRVLRQLAGIAPGRRFPRSVWPANIPLAAAEAVKRLQQKAEEDHLDGMECRLWVLDYRLLNLGGNLLITDARLQVDCRR